MNDAPYLLIDISQPALVFSRHRTLEGMARTQRDAYLPLAPRMADGSRLSGEDLEEWIRVQDDLCDED